MNSSGTIKSVDPEVKGPVMLDTGKMFLNPSVKGTAAITIKAITINPIVKRYCSQVRRCYEHPFGWGSDRR